MKARTKRRIWLYALCLVFGVVGRVLLGYGYIITAEVFWMMGGTLVGWVWPLPLPEEEEE